MKTLSRISALLLATVALGGCSSLFGITFAHKGSHGLESMPTQMAGAQVELATARSYMEAGMTAAAIDHFRAAQLDPDSLPAATNGLGVAYARLGRYDLADRYFRTAMALEPGNEEFAANMLRLQRDYALASARNQEAAERMAEAKAATEAAELAQANLPGSIMRISPGEVHIVTAPLGAAPTAVVASRDAEPRQPAANRGGGEKGDSRYPVRIELSHARDQGRSDEVAVEYPQRIDLSKVVYVN